MYGVRYDFSLIFQDLIRKLFPSQKCRVYMILPLVYYGTAGNRIESRIGLNVDKLFCKQACTFRNSFFVTGFMCELQAGCGFSLFLLNSYPELPSHSLNLQFLKFGDLTL